MPDPTDAEIQAGANAIARSWRVLSPISRRHLAKLVLSAVLPGHDARVRSDERQRMEAAGWRPPIRHGDPYMLAAVYGYELGQQDARAAAIARQHATTAEGDHHA